jgi:NADH:ubiquinone oxidoreductase subunit 6 (subunit J)
MIAWIFSAIALGAALIATFVNSMRVAILSLWLAGLAMGGLYLTLGAETLAVLQWIASTLIAISLFFFAVMFGEYEKPARFRSTEPGEKRKTAFLIGIASALGAAFASVIYVGASEFPQSVAAFSKLGNDLASIGRIMVENHMLSLEVLGLTLFLILVGGGVVARPESSSDEPGYESEEKSC